MLRKVITATHLNITHIKLKLRPPRDNGLISKYSMELCKINHPVNCYKNTHIYFILFCLTWLRQCWNPQYGDPPIFREVVAQLDLSHSRRSCSWEWLVSPMGQLMFALVLTFVCFVPSLWNGAPILNEMFLICVQYLYHLMDTTKSTKNLQN